MSALGSEALGISATGDFTSVGTTLMPTVTRVESRIDVNPVSVILAISIVFVLAPITISSNTMILAAFYRYKRLRTASNCLLASLAVSDFGVGIFMPFGMHLELSGLPDTVEVSTVCIVPYCIVIALCSVSVLVSVAIAVDRLTSLAQPLRYKNIITHSSVEKYIAVFWLYSIGVGLSPLIYSHIMGLTQSHSGSCRFGAAVRPPVQVFLVIAVWAPSALVLLGCYMYVYLVARAHARAIYTVELSFRHQTQTMTLPRYGQTLAVTVGAFLVLWVPFQTCMLLDIFCGTRILSEWAVVWLGLPILAHSAANPWIYAFHHGEMRLAATKIAEDVVTRFGIHPSRHGCSPLHRGSNANFELAEVNKTSAETRRPPIEDCFAAKHNLTTLLQREKSKCPPDEFISSATDVSPEGVNTSGRYCVGRSTAAADIIEEDIHDLTNMLRPEYAIDRNHLIDSNHNIDRIRHLKHLLDPTFNRLRNIKRLNHKLGCTSKNASRFDKPKFISYQNLKSDADSSENIRQFNAMSDPTLNADNTRSKQATNDHGEVSPDDSSSLPHRIRSSNLASMSDPNLKARDGNAAASDSTKVRNDRDRTRDVDHGCTVQSLEHDEKRRAMRSTLQCRRIDKLRKSGDPQGGTALLRNFEFDGNCRVCNNRLGHAEVADMAERRSVACELSNERITLTTNRLANLANSLDREMPNGTRNAISACHSVGRLLRREFVRHSESISEIARTRHERLPEPTRFMDSLAVPTIQSEPPSPVEPLPFDSLVKEQPREIFSHTGKNASSSPTMRNPWDTCLIPENRNHDETLVRNPTRLSDPTIPYVLLNFEETRDSLDARNLINSTPPMLNEFGDIAPHGQTQCGVMEPEKLATALILSAVRTHDRRPSDAIFTEHDSTRFSSRRPSDLRWSESSRSQEIMPKINDHRRSPSSYSVINFGDYTSVDDSNDVTCLGSFVCPDPLTSSLRESFFETPSIINSDVFTSLEELENPDVLLPINDNGKAATSSSSSSSSSSSIIPMVHYSVSSVNLERSMRHRRVDERFDDNQSKSSESVMKKHHHRRAIFRLEGSIHRNQPRTMPGNDGIIEDSTFKINSRLAPLAVQTPMEISTPTYDTTMEIRGTSGVGVRV